MNKNRLTSLLLSLAFCVGVQAQSYPVVFDFTSVRDTQNRYTGSLQNGASLSTWTSPGGTTYNVLDLGGSNGYFDLSSQFGTMIKSLGSTFSISVDVLVPTTTDISGNGNFIWCFSYSSSNGYLFLNAKETRYAITNRTYSQEQSVNPAQSLQKGKWVNVIYVQNGSTGTVYVNNEQKAQNTNMSLYPSGLSNNLQNNYLGRSCYNGDAYLKNALYKSLRVYNTALSEQQRADLTSAIDDMYAVNDNQAVALDMASVTVPRVAYKHINLPTEGENGSSISWVSSDPTHLAADGTVVKQETDRDVTVTLTATFSKGAVTQTKTYNVKVKQTENYSHYLFAFFPSNSDENIYFAVGEDGYNYTTINNDQAVFLADGNTVMGGLRDPHILRGEDGNFYMVATDMKSALGWSSNRGMVLMKSPDLINWTSSTVHFPTKYAGTYLANVTRVWAPQTIYDAEADKYMIYFSILTNDGTVSYDKDYYCYANADFTDLEGTPTYFYDRGSATIDMDIVYNEADGLYHGFYKNEGSGGICKVTAERLTPAAGEADGSQWGSPSGTLQQTNEAVEGAGVFRLINDDSWILMYDCYSNGHYQFCSSPDLSTFTFVKNTATSGTFTPRHGTVIPITEAEYQALLQAFPCPALTEETDPDSDGNLNLTKERISQLCESTSGWTSINGFGTHDASPYTNGDAVVGGTFLERWAYQASIGSNSASKTLRYLPAGTYKLQASCIATWQYDASVTVSGVTLFADDQTADVHTANGVPELYTLNFDIVAADDYTTTLGIETSAETTANWVAFDNFRLYFIGTEAQYHAALRQMQLDYVARAEALYPQLCPTLLTPLQQAVAAVDVDATDYSTVVSQLDRLCAAIEAAQESLASVIILREDAANTIAAQTGAHVHVYRPMKAAEWNTLCLPFAMSAAQVSSAFGEEAVIKQLSYADGADNLTLHFARVYSIAANVPYIIQSDQVKDFYCVEATSIVPPPGTPATELSSISFCGNYTPSFPLTTSDYYLKANKIYKSNGNAKMKAFRAYFEVPTAQQVKSISADFGDTVTGIKEVQSTQQSEVYDLSGRKMTDGPLSRGLYIIDGRKVSVK